MKTYELFSTKHPDLFRVVDRDGNWTHYSHKPTNTYLRAITDILDAGYAKGPGYDEWLSRHTPQERAEILAATGERGDKVHRAIDQLLTSGGTIRRDGKIFSRAAGKDEEISNSEWDALLSFACFWRKHEPILFVSEASVFSLKHGYAGTADAVISLTKTCDVKMCRCKELIGRIGLWDWKTSSGIRSNYSSQAAAYAMSDNIKDYLPARSKIGYIGILRIGTQHKTTGGYEFKTFDVKESFSRFLAAKEIADYDYQPFTPEDIADIPDDITLKVDVFVETKKEKKQRKPRAKTKKEKKQRKPRAKKITQEITT